LTPARTTSCWAASGKGKDPLGSKPRVSVSLHDAWSRLICAGWLPAGPCVRLERCAGLRTGVGQNAFAVSGCS
jgi:hypothetical protein